MKPLRILFAGTPEFAVPTLNALLASDHSVVAVFTQPDRPAGRGRKLRASPVKEVALQRQIPVYQPASLKGNAEIELVQQLAPDLMVVVAYGLILPEAILSIPHYGCMNVHGSILPRWRGAAPIARAILAGDQETGVTIMQMDRGLDTGDMLSITTCPIDAKDTADSLQKRLAQMGAQSLLEVLALLQQNRLQPQKQSEEQATYAHKILKAEAQIQWSQPATDILLKIRAFHSWPVAQTLFQGEVLRIWQAEPGDINHLDKPGKIIDRDASSFSVATGKGVIRVLSVQMPGKKQTSARDFMNAVEVQGHSLGQPGDLL